MEAFDSNAVVLLLESASKIKKLLSLNFPYVGNMSSTVLSFLFLRLIFLQ